MNIFPTLDGGLRLEIETTMDWQILMAISLDAENDLAGELSELMDEESMWDEIIAPELQSHFSSQLEHVLKVVRECRERSAGEDLAELHIPKEDGEIWYGALNQARLALEEKYQFDSCEVENFEELGEAMKHAFFRNRFYNQIQGLLLEYVME